MVQAQFAHSHGDMTRLCLHNGRVMVASNMPVLGSLQGPVRQPGGRLGCSIAHTAQHSLQIHLQGQGQREALQSTGCLHHRDKE